MSVKAMRVNVMKVEPMVESEGHMPSRSQAPHKHRTNIPPAKVLGRYRGKWVAFYDRKVLAAGDSLHKVVDEARAALPGKESTVMKVPSGELYVL